MLPAGHAAATRRPHPSPDSASETCNRSACIGAAVSRSQTALSPVLKWRGSPRRAQACPGGSGTQARTWWCDHCITRSSAHSLAACCQGAARRGTAAAAHTPRISSLGTAWRGAGRHGMAPGACGEVSHWLGGRRWVAQGCSGAPLPPCRRRLTFSGCCSSTQLPLCCREAFQSYIAEDAFFLRSFGARRLPVLSPCAAARCRSRAPPGLARQNACLMCPFCPLLLQPRGTAPPSRTAARSRSTSPRRYASCCRWGGGGRRQAAGPGRGWCSLGCAQRRTWPGPALGACPDGLRCCFYCSNAGGGGGAEAARRLRSGACVGGPPVPCTPRCSGPRCPSVAALCCPSRPALSACTP